MRNVAAKRVLVVEDDPGVREMVLFHLRLAHYDATAAHDGKAGLEALRSRPFDLVILDLMLPGIDGVTLCHMAREDGPNRDVPILMLTARREESDKVLGLKSGADDYLTKPFGVREFLARLEALLRRPRSTWRTAPRAREQPTISLAGIVIDPQKHVVTCDGHSVSLTPQEFDFLYVLISNPGVVFERDELLSRVWSDDVSVTDRGVDTLVKRLRRKIEVNPRNPSRILTVWGSGYKFAEGQN